MLVESKLYSFIDQKEGFTLHFLEGQKLIHDLALTHTLKAEGFHFFRDVTLSTQLLLAYLKPMEGLGIYIDSESPYFKFKIEMNELGQMRTLLLPEELSEFPKHIKGQCRLVKLVPEEKTPYTSIISLQDTGLNEIINKLLKESYQLNSQIYLSDESDQSLMISKLPSINIDKIETNYRLSIDEYWIKNKKAFNDIFAKHPSDYAEIQSSFESLGLFLLSSKEVAFKCQCNRDRMAHGLASLIKSAGIDNVFMPEEKEITSKCDYCHKTYTFYRTEFFN